MSGDYADTYASPYGVPSPYGSPYGGGACLGWDANALGNGTGWMTVETYAGSIEEAERLVSTIVGKGLASTGHIEEVKSTYWWQGQLVTSNEWRVAFDVGQALASPVANEILALHSYQLPVILLRPFAPATMDARAWLTEPSFGTNW
jgi:periplasmic divalent cation tolerance protein